MHPIDSIRVGRAGWYRRRHRRLFSWWCNNNGFCGDDFPPGQFSTRSAQGPLEWAPINRNFLLLPNTMFAYKVSELENRLYFQVAAIKQPNLHLLVVYCTKIS